MTIRYPLLGLLGLAAVPLLLGLAPQPKRLTAAEMEAVIGASTFTCIDTGLTCDMKNNGNVCGVERSEGDLCLALADVQLPVAQLTLMPAAD